MSGMIQTLRSRWVREREKKKDHIKLCKGGKSYKKTFCNIYDEKKTCTKGKIIKVYGNKTRKHEYTHKNISLRHDKRKSKKQLGIIL